MRYKLISMQMAVPQYDKLRSLSKTFSFCAAEHELCELWLMRQ